MATFMAIFIRVDGSRKGLALAAAVRDNFTIGKEKEQPWRKG